MTFLSPLCRMGLLGCLAWPAAALAQPADSSAAGTLTPSEHGDASSAAGDDAAPIIYTPADFARFSPRTALDMVNQIPDFTLTETSDDRGLGQASQNVLVNGQRVAGKSNDAQTTLARISAQSVERIEIVEGARLGIPGLTGKVANVVLSSGRVQIQFNWEGQQRRHIEDQIFTGALSANGQIGATDFTLSLSNSNGLRRGGVGPEIVRDGAGALILSRLERDSYSADRPRLAGSIHHEALNGSILNLNLAGELYYYRVRFDGVATPAAGTPITTEHLFQREDEWNIEGGGDYEFAVGDGRLKIIGLQRYEHSPVVVTATDSIVGIPDTGSRFTQTANEGESVLRAEYGWGGDSQWQVALEAAYNFIDITSGFDRLQSNGSYASVPLTNGSSFVDEWRGEGTITHGWSLATGLTLQTTLGAEVSQISQTGTSGLTRRFFRPKGSAALAWTVSPRLTVNASLERQVGQLSFYDFSAAVDLQNGVTSAGNVQLVPEQTRHGEVEAIQSFGSAGSITLGAYHEWISDIVDRIPISATEEGIGNLPHARRWAITARGTLLLDGLGWHGGRINASSEFRNSSVRDPLTGENRRISADLVRRWSVDLRHDIPHSNLAWGASMSEELFGATFRLDQVYSARLSQPIATLFIEHKNIFGLKVRLGLRNVLNGHDDIRHVDYVTRRNGPVDSSAQQLRYIHVIGVLSISGNF